MLYIPTETRHSIAQLKRSGDLLGAARILRRLMAAELEAGGQPYAWPFEQAAIVYRKLKDHPKEVEVLEWFADASAFCGLRERKLYDRLLKAYRLAGLLRVDDSGTSLVTSRGVSFEEVFMDTGAVVDTETTGVMNQDEVIELGIVQFRYSKRTGLIHGATGEYHGLREPFCRSHRAAVAKHRIKDSELLGRRLDVQAVRELLGNSKVLVAHNAAFDRRMLDKLFPDLGRKSWACTLNGITWESESRRLEDLLRLHQIETPGLHRALNDAQALFALLGAKDAKSAEPYSLELFSGGALRPLTHTASGPATGSEARLAQQESRRPADPPGKTGWFSKLLKTVLPSKGARGPGHDYESPGEAPIERPETITSAWITGGGKFSTDTVGESHHQKRLGKIAGGYVLEGVNVEQDATLVLEDDHPYDTEAVAIQFQGLTVSYLSNVDAKKLREKLSHVANWGVPIRCRACIQGGWRRSDGDTSNFTVWLDLG